MSAARSLATTDRLDILDLYARQAHAIDRGDADVWAACFTDSGVFISPTFQLTASGQQELRDFAESSHAAAAARGEQLRHWMDAIVMVPVSQNAVHVDAYLMILATSGAAGSRIDRSLRVEDDLERVDGDWYLASRTVVRDA